ncbi:MAG: tetratricopeptide repeat protein [Verrucomicrobiota bacterium]
MASLSAQLQQALQLHRRGQLAEAAALYERVLRTHPAEADALLLLGQVHLQQGAGEQAEARFAQAVALRPHTAAYQLNHGLALRRLGRAAEALDALARARALDPALAEAQHQTGNVLKSLGRPAEAIPFLREAVRLAPAQAPAWLNLGGACLEGGALDEALAAFARALALEPARPEAHNILGHALLTAGRTTEAEAAFTAALRLRPNYAAPHDNLGRLCRSVGRLPEAVGHFRAALALTPDPQTHSNLLFALNFLPTATPAEVCAEHRRWHQLYAAPLAPDTPRPPPRARDGRRLRVGYVSPDFAHHAVAYFIEPVLAAHDRTRVEVFCYASVGTPDRFTARLRTQAEHWRDIAQLGDEAAAARIRADDLDLLVDLAGHTTRNRLRVLARRPAPVQATWIGYPNTTGLDAIDYRLTDAVSDPPGQTEAWHSERLVRLPENFSCYRPDDDAPPVNELPALTSGALTLGSLNQFAKVTPDVIALWARVLTALPAARLLLKSRGLHDAGTADRVRAAFAAAGVAPARLILHGAELSVAAHLGLYHGVDLALDPFPYNGTTTTCEALWMGVPVLTLAGQTHVARVGASLLTHAGLPDWITATPDAYVARAVAAAADRPALAALRRRLREHMRASPLCDAPRFTRGLEAAYAAMADRRA